MTAVRVVVPDTGPLITLAKLGLLDVLLCFKESVRIVLTDYVEFEATRRRGEFPDAVAIHKFIRDNYGRIEIEKTSFGTHFKQVYLLQEKLAKQPELAAQLGVNMEPVENVGELTIVQYVMSLVDHPPGVPVLILAEDDYFLRELAPLPTNAHVVSTRKLLLDLPHIAKLKDNPALWDAVATFREGSERAAIVDRQASKISTTWHDAVDGDAARAVVRRARRRP